jgi:hypothetical protein
MLLRAAAMGTRAFVNQTPSWPKGASLLSGEKHPACFRVKPVDMLRHFAGGIPESEVQSAGLAPGERALDLGCGIGEPMCPEPGEPAHITVYAEGV